MKKINYMLPLIIMIFSFSPESEDLIAPGAELEKLSGGFSFTEGPAVDSEGNVFFTDQPNDRIMKWGINEVLTTWMMPSGRSNGLSFDTYGNLWACADEKNELWKISPDKEVEVIVSRYEEKLLNGPNDLWIHPDGGVFFSDPFYKRPWWHHEAMQQEGQYVFHLSPDGKKIVKVEDSLVQPNGIIGTPDGNILYITDIQDRKTYRYKITSDGSLINKELFCEMGSDGMTIDDQGNIYLTGKGVFVFNSQGKLIEHIEIPEPWTANVCFGGKDKKSLFITASKGLYRLQMNVSGVGSQ